MFSGMSHGVGYHECKQQHGRQRKSEAIQIVIEFTFRDMPHFFVAVGCQQSAVQQEKERLCYMS